MENSNSEHIRTPKELSGYLWTVKQSCGTITGGRKIPYKTKRARTKFFGKWYLNGKKFYEHYTDSPSLKIYANQKN